MSLRPEIVDDLLMGEWTGAEPADAEEPVLVFTIHDGSEIPRHLLGEPSESVLAREDIGPRYVQERDWGANLVARHLSRELGLSGYLRVRLARVVMDYGRFPGASGPNDDYLQRLALFPPFSEILSEEQKHLLLKRYYDGFSHELTTRVAEKTICLSVHTYDRFNASGTERPEISLVSRLLEYQIHSDLPPDAFDPLFPSILCEATSHRALTYPILANLEREGFHSAHNYPYVMPLGSLEIRAQVWYFFRHLRDRFQETCPETRDRPPYQRVWMMLFDVIRRSSESSLLRGYLHKYRDAPSGQEDLYAEARQAYAEIRRFLAAHRRTLVEDYRFSPYRPSSLGIEIRKDLLCDIARDRRTVRLRDDAELVAERISRPIAAAVRSYLSRERPDLGGREAESAGGPFAPAGAVLRGGNGQSGRL